MKTRISRREFLRTAGAAAATLPFAGVGGVIGAEKRPNFLFILTDDQRWDAMSCAGHPFLRTPNMDRIAREGARFRNAFVTTSLCAPSRACCLTGRCAHSHGVRNNGIQFDDGNITYPRLLQQAGYDTAFIGKWHMGGQEGPRPGFNRWVSFKGQGVYRNPALNIDGEKVQATGYMTDILTKYAVEWLKKPRNTPFSLCLWHKAVHGPFQPALRHAKLFSDVKIPRPENMNDDYEGRPAWFKLGMEPGHDSKGVLKDASKLSDLVLDYCRTLKAVDDGVGRVLAALEETGELDNTVIVFAGDNGYFLGEHGRLDKRTMNEESIRIPLLIRYPRLIRPGSLPDEMALNVDIAPTFLDLAGVSIPREVHGRSLRQVFRGKSKLRDDFLYEYFEDPGFRRTPTMRGIRTERWKYVEYPFVEDIPELYDLKNDPTEMRNLAADPKHAHVLSDMQAGLKRLMQETGLDPNLSK